MSVLENLKRHSVELTRLHHILGLMQWDQEVRMPSRAAPGRAEQFAALTAIVHQKEVLPELGEWLKAAADERLSPVDHALVRVMRRAYEQNTKLPEDFVIAFSRLTAQALDAWVMARRRDDFPGFVPYLAKIIEMSRQKAEYLGYAAHPYDALLDLHEEGLRAGKVESMFDAIRLPLQALAGRARQAAQPRLAFATPFAEEAQVAFSEKLLLRMGFDFDRGCLARSAHPFSTTLGHHDRRVTNRYQPHSLEFIFGALHEGGHALYEQGVAEDLADTHLDGGVSLGIHESQSRLWENIIGRSKAFAEFLLPNLQQSFPAQFTALDPTTFYRGINCVQPGLIRVAADEVTYNLHVLIRFELEKALMEGTLAAQDLPGAWKEKYRDYLDVTVPSDADGVLQDIHWAHGSIGYFPTYTIGNLAAAQIWQAYTAENPGHAARIASGELGPVHAWLTDRIYRHGSIYPPDELLRRITGQDLAPRAYLDYLATKYTWLAG